MGIPSAGTIVLVPFPFSDLSQSKLRPAIVLADANRGDWILCQITSKAFADPAAVTLTINDLTSGQLRFTSYARPGKLFTAHQGLFVAEIGMLNDSAFNRVLDAVEKILKSSRPS